MRMHGGEVGTLFPEKGKSMTDEAIVLSPAERDLILELRRQVAEEGWTEEHDDQHTDGSLAEAAVCYASKPSRRFHWSGELAPRIWPWDPEWWKPTTLRRDLVKAAALIIAEIRRLDRLEARSGK